MKTLLAVPLILAALAVAPFTHAQFPATAVVYRYYTPLGPDHLYTTNPQGESPQAMARYGLDGPAFKVLAQAMVGFVPFYRFQKPNGNHFYTTNPTEGRGFLPEGIVGFISPSPRPGLVPLYRWYNPMTQRHFFTTNPAGEFAPGQGYLREFLAGYVVPAF